MTSLVAVRIGAWFASFSAGASAGGGHLNILNPESCLDDEPLWQFLHKRSEFPAVSTQPPTIEMFWSLGLSIPTRASLWNRCGGA